MMCEPHIVSFASPESVTLAEHTIHTTTQPRMKDVINVLELLVKLRRMENVDWKIECFNHVWDK